MTSTPQMHTAARGGAEHRPRGRGRLVTLEGVDGAGKSTQLAALAQALALRGVDFVQTREPGGTVLGESLRDLMLGTDMTALTETLLMFAARSEHIARVIEPALAGGRWVLCDRFTDASFAYQGGGRAVPREWLASLALWVQAGLVPDLTVLVDVSPAEAQRRRAQARAADRFEAESSSFFERVRTAYLERAQAEPQRFLRVDGAMAPTEVTAQILERIEQWLPRKP